MRKNIGFALGSHSPGLGSKRSQRSGTYWKARIDSMTYVIHPSTINSNITIDTNCAVQL